MNDVKLLLKIILIIIIISIIVIKWCSNKSIINQNFTKFTRNINITAIVLNYNRPHNIPKLVEKLKNIKVINEIIISHGKKETTILIDDPIVVNETEVGNKYFSANRFEIADMAKNDYIMFIDDDIYPSNRWVNKVIRKINNDGLTSWQNLYSPYPRICNNSIYKFSSMGLNYNIVLTKLAIIRKDRAVRIWNKMKETKYLDILLENKGNGEDIVFSTFVRLFGGKNIHVSGKIYELDGDNGYSSMDTHYLKRDNLCNDLNKSIYNNDFNQIIEKNIMQTSYHKSIEDLPIKIQNNIKKMKQENPEYKYYYYNNDDIIDFIKSNYDNEVLRLYNCINDCYGAAKSDFFRYLWIYRMGGVYLDIKSGLTNKISDIIKPFDEIILSSWFHKKMFKYNIYKSYGENILNTGFGEFLQWNIISRKGHPFLKAVIDQIKLNIKLNNKKHIGKELILQTTGPTVYTKEIIKILPYHNFTFYNNKINNSLKYTIFKSHKIHRTKVQSGNDYTICNKRLSKC